MDEQVKLDVIGMGLIARVSGVVPSVDHGMDQPAHWLLKRRGKIPQNGDARIALRRRVSLVTEQALPASRSSLPHSSYMLNTSPSRTTSTSGRTRPIGCTATEFPVSQC